MIPGTVARVAPLVDERTRSFKAVVEVKGREELVGGLFARASVAVGTVRGALVVPPAALVRDGSDPLRAEVFVVRQGKAERQAIELGVEAADGVQATSGLASGDVVVLDPPATLSSGSAVEPQNGRPAAASRCEVGRARHVPEQSLDQAPRFRDDDDGGAGVLGIASYSQLKVDLFPKIEIPVVTVTTIYAGRRAGDGRARGDEEDRGGDQHRRGRAPHRVDLAGGTLATSWSSSSSRSPQWPPPRTCAARSPRSAASCRARSRSRSSSASTSRRCPCCRSASTRPGSHAQAATNFADKVVKRRIENVRGVGSVALVGESTREIQVVVDRLKLEAYHVSLAEVVSALARENVDVPAGTADRGPTEALVRVAARGRSAADIGVIPIKRPEGATVYVRDVAQVIDGIARAEERRPARRARRRSRSTSRSSPGANTVAVADGVIQAVEKLKSELPAGISLKVITGRLGLDPRLGRGRQDRR